MELYYILGLPLLFAVVAMSQSGRDFSMWIR